jgi:hypothetical protein
MKRVKFADERVELMQRIDALQVQVIELQAKVIELTPQPPTPKLTDWALQLVKNLELSVRSDNCLRNSGVIYVGQLVQMCDAELLRIPNFGRRSLNERRQSRHCARPAPCNSVDRRRLSPASPRGPAWRKGRSSSRGRRTSQ